MQLNDDVREFFANYCRAFEAFDACALSAFFSYLVLFTKGAGPTPNNDGIGVGLYLGDRAAHPGIS